MRLALRQLGRHPGRSFSSALGLALGIAALVATLSVGDHVHRNLSRALETTVGEADLLAIPGASERAIFAADELLTALQDAPGVASVEPVLDYPAAFAGGEASRGSLIPGFRSGFQLSGRQTERTETLRAALREGDLPRRGSHGLALPEAYARARGLERGDSVTLQTASGDVHLTLTGLLRDTLSVSGGSGGRVGIVHLEDLREQTSLPGRATHVALRLTTDAHLKGLEQYLASELGDAYRLTSPASAADLPRGLSDTLAAGLQLLAGVLLALGGFLAYNSCAAGVVERRREYALLRTLCLSQRQLHQVALLEALLLGFTGIVLGLVLGILSTLGLTQLSALLLGFYVEQLHLPVTSMLLAAAAGLIVSLIAGLAPARRAARTPPLSALRNYHHHEPKATLLAPLLGVAAAVSRLLPWPEPWSAFGAGVTATLLFLSVLRFAPTLLALTLRLASPTLKRFHRHSAQLACNFTQRSAERNAVAIATVGLGVSLVLAVGAMISGFNRAFDTWVERTLSGDLFVEVPPNTPGDFAARASQLAEIDQASGVTVRVTRFRPTDAPERSLATVFVEPERFQPGSGFSHLHYLAGDPEEAHQALLAGDAVLASTTVATRFGLELGEAVQLRTHEGYRAFRLAGVVVDLTNGGESFIAPLSALPKFGGGTPELYVMTLPEGVTADAAERALEHTFPEHTLIIAHAQAYRQQILSLAQDSFFATHSLLLIAVAVSALSVSNTLAMNLPSRSREIATLRALGMTRRDIKQLLYGEGIIVTLLGSVCGVVAGLVLSGLVTRGASSLTGFAITPAFPLPLIATTLIAAPLLGIAASLWPARRAAQLPPAHAMRATG